MPGNRPGPVILLPGVEPPNFFLWGCGGTVGGLEKRVCELVIANVVRHHFLENAGQVAHYRDQSCVLDSGRIQNIQGTDRALITDTIGRRDQGAILKRRCAYLASDEY